MNVHELRKKVKNWQKNHQKVLKSWSEWSGKATLSLAVFTIFSFAFFIFSPRIFGQTEPLSDSGIREASEQNLDSNKVKIVYRKGNPNGDYVELIVQVEGSSLIANRTYEAAAADIKTKQRLSAKVTYLYGDFYLIQLDKIPLQWRQLQLAFGYTSVVNEEEKIVAVTYYLSRDKIELSSKVKPLSKLKYAILLSELEESMTEDLIACATENIDTWNEEIKAIDQKLKQNKEDMKFQNTEQRGQTESANQSLERQKNNLKEQIDNEKMTISQYEDQINKSQDRRTELQKELTKEQ
ncbi:hypothetical protein MZM67_002436 [Enterococcus faecium]|nr:hypothetical protein [Enterococcus faecium]